MSDSITERIEKRLQGILQSQHRDELIKGLMIDLHMYVQADLSITKVIRSNKSDKEKVELIKELVMYLEQE